MAEVVLGFKKSGGTKFRAHEYGVRSCDVTFDVDTFDERTAHDSSGGKEDAVPCSKIFGEKNSVEPVAPASVFKLLDLGIACSPYFRLLTTAEASDAFFYCLSVNSG